MTPFTVVEAPERAEEHETEAEPPIREAVQRLREAIATFETTTRSEYSSAAVFVDADQFEALGGETMLCNSGKDIVIVKRLGAITVHLSSATRQQWLERLR